MTYRARWILCVPAVVLLALCFVVPLVGMGRLSLNAGGGESGFGLGGALFEPGTWTLAAYAELLASPYFREVLWFTLWFGVAVAVLCVLIAYPLALAISRLSPSGRALALAVVTLPKLANVLVVVYGLKLMLGNAGPVNELLLWLGVVETPVRLLNNLAGVFIGKTYLILPYTVLLLTVALMRIDPELMLAARGLGARRLQRFLRVTLPLSLPGLAMAFFVSLVFGVGAFVTPFLMGSPDQITVSVDVQRQTFENLNWPRGAAESMIMLAVLAAALVMGAALRGPRRGRRIP